MSDRFGVLKLHLPAIKISSSLHRVKDKFRAFFFHGKVPHRNREAVSYKL